MDKLKLPAYPLPIALHNNGTLNTTLDVDNASVGFTKHEKAALMIAQGLVSKYNMTSPSDQETIAKLSLELAEEILNRAEKWTE